jgi:hypothetical protein
MPEEWSFSSTNMKNPRLELQFQHRPSLHSSKTKPTDVSVVGMA